MSVGTQIGQAILDFDKKNKTHATHVKLSPELHMILKADFDDIMRFFQIPGGLSGKVHGLIIVEVEGTNILEVYHDPATP